MKLAETNGIQPAEQIRKQAENKLSLQVLEEAKRMAYQCWIRLKNKQINILKGSANQ